MILVCTFSLWCSFFFIFYQLEFKTGWWNITDLELLKQMSKAFNERGARECELRRFVERNFNIIKRAISKVCIKGSFDSVTIYKCVRILIDFAFR